MPRPLVIVPALLGLALQLERQDHWKLAAARTHDLWQPAFPIQGRLRLELTRVTVDAASGFNLDTRSRGFRLTACLCSLGLSSGLHQLGARQALGSNVLRVGLALGFYNHGLGFDLGALAILLRLHTLRTRKRSAVQRLLVLD